MAEYHQPVLLKECIEGLSLVDDGVYVDVTFGGGGHSREILKNLSGGRLIAFDQDEDAKAEAEKIKDDRLVFIKANFAHIGRFLKMAGISEVNGIIADLGISSHQIDVPERGFSVRYDAPLDMRMNTNASLSARQIVNDYSEEQLMAIFKSYGELKNAYHIARELLKARVSQPIETTGQLKDVLKGYAPRGRENKFYGQLFQALRIEVNQEMQVLESFLMDVPGLLKKEGRLVVMSYHSLEDRRVKNFLNAGNFSGEQQKTVYGDVIRPLEPVTRKPIVASDDEIANNNRARSAKLRIGRKK